MPQRFFLRVFIDSPESQKIVTENLVVLNNPTNSVGTLSLRTP